MDGSIISRQVAVMSEMVAKTNKSHLPLESTTIRTFKTEPPPPFSSDRLEKKGGGWFSSGNFPDLGPLFERFPLKESLFRGPQNPKIFRLRRALPPNRAILADILGYLGVSPLETADLGSGAGLPNLNHPLSEIRAREKKGGGWFSFQCPDGALQSRILDCRGEAALRS